MQSDFHRGEPAIFFAKENTEVLTWIPSLTEVWSVFDTFGLKSAFTVGLLDDKDILIRFNCEDDYHRI